MGYQISGSDISPNLVDKTTLFDLYPSLSNVIASPALWVWGHNATGQLGDNTVTSKSSPVQTIAGGTNWKSVANGVYHTAAIKTDGTLWTFGYNAYGQLGDNTLTHSASPVQTITGGTNWKSVSTGYGTTALIEL